MEVKPCHFLDLHCAMASSLTQRKSWPSYRDLQGPECLPPLPAPSRLWLHLCSSVCLLTCLQLQASPESRPSPPHQAGSSQEHWPTLEPRYLLSQLFHLLQILAKISPFHWGLLWLPYSAQWYGPALATYAIPIPSPPLFFFLSTAPEAFQCLLQLTDQWTDWRFFFYCYCLLHYHTSSVMAGVVCFINWCIPRLYHCAWDCILNKWEQAEDMNF